MTIDEFKQTVRVRGVARKSSGRTTRFDRWISRITAILHVVCVNTHTHTHTYTHALRSVF